MVSAPRAGQGLTSARIRHYHHRVILQRCAGLGEASKADLARAVNLTNTAIGQIVSTCATRPRFSDWQAL